MHHEEFKLFTLYYVNCRAKLWILATFLSVVVEVRKYVVIKWVTECSASSWLFNPAPVLRVGLGS